MRLRRHRSRNRCHHAEVDLSLQLSHGDDRSRFTLPWAMCALSAGIAAIAVSMTVSEQGGALAGDMMPSTVLGIGTALLGALILSREKGHVLGWLFAIYGLSQALGVMALAWRIQASGLPVDYPPGAAPSWLQACLTLPATILAPVIAVLFPDGRLPGRRWHIVPWLAGVALVLFAIGLPIAMWPYRGESFVTETVTWGSLRTSALVVLLLGSVLAAVAMALALIAVVVRVRGTTGDLRQQAKWFGLGMAASVVLAIAGLALQSWELQSLSALAALTGILLGILRFRLYDVDRFIGRTAAYVITTAGLIVTFAALDITMAVVLGGGSVVVAAISAFTVALLLRPALDYSQGLVDRFFDRRAYDAVRRVRELGEQAGVNPVAPSELIDGLRRALGDPGLQVYFRTQAGHLVDCDGQAVAEPQIIPGQVADPVARADETLGLIVHTPGEPELFAAVVRAAAVALEHARLQSELRGNVAEIRESRRRLVGAEAAERRRIERNLHDGAQQRLVGLALHIQAAKRRASYPPEVEELLTFTVGQINAGVEDIRSLVSGFLPPALVTGGLPAAFSDVVYPPQVSIACDVPQRLDPDLETTAWFVACEAVANAIKHAPGCAVTVKVRTSTGCLVVEVRDTGPGGADPRSNGLRGLADRAEAHGGTLRVVSPPGGGTRLRLELPCGS